MTTPDARPLHLLLILASVRDGRLAPRIGSWAEKQVAGHPDFSSDLIDLRDLALHDDLSDSRGKDRLADAVGSADAICIVTPEYNHSYPGPLKTAMDSLRGEWLAKPVGFISYGGVGGGLRAVEALRAVVAELHMVSVRTSASIHGVFEALGDESGTETLEVSAQAAQEMLGQLSWWGRALRAMRLAEPYPT